jgi:hypothetical protein
VFFLVGLGFELRASCLQSRRSTSSPHLQSILSWLFWKWGLANYLPELALNNDPPNLNLPSSQDYRREPLAPSQNSLFLTQHPSRGSPSEISRPAGSAASVSWLEATSWTSPQTCRLRTNTRESVSAPRGGICEHWRLGTLGSGK